MTTRSRILPPGAPYSSNLAVFDGQDPNGNWSTYVFDDSAGNTGTLASGWSLDISAILITCCQGAALRGASINVN